MKNKKLLLLGVIGLAMLSSCGIFHKSCNCPHFSENVKPGKARVVTYS